MPTIPPVAVGDDGREIYHTDDGEYVVSYRGQWLPGSWASVAKAKAADLSEHTDLVPDDPAASPAADPPS